MSLTKSLSIPVRTVLLTLLLICVAGRASAEMLSGSALVEHLRQGGYVLLMRHASSPAALPDKHSADPQNTALERQLDDRGRSSATAMGQAIKRLGIPIGAVLSSPTYRALETVHFASFGAAKTYSQLGDGGQSMQASAIAGQSDWLREKVSERPAPGSNTIIVTHMPNIVASFDGVASDLTDGEALVFQPKENGKSDLVAKIKIEDWPSFTQKQ